MLIPAFALAALLGGQLVADATPPPAPLPAPDPTILQSMPPADPKLVEQDVRQLQKTTQGVALRFGVDLGGMARCGADTTDLARLATAMDGKMVTWAPGFGADKVVPVVQEGMKLAARTRHGDGATFCKHMRERYLRYRGFLENGDAQLLRPE